ncbi:hypothetical protein ACPPTR_14365 [Ralstonia pseudosolanacearum]|uniref:hypothetical protein n=1 Tax=Ralstonia pseudosolanacearum TaxID=1310165 RepID=UPI000B92E388|nr:hypothetical protein [Ralstonia pseudosolanacearum]MCD9230760.1 hypothetical protein [Ralstonia pseudosolanacearum]
MNIAKILGKKWWISAAIAAGALATGSAGAEGLNLGTAGTPYLKAYNSTSHCVRFFVNGTKDVPAGKAPQSLGTVKPNKQYMASVFSGACGGKALRNIWYTTTSVSQQTWTVSGQ